MKTIINKAEKITDFLDKNNKKKSIIISDDSYLKCQGNIQIFSIKELCKYLLKKSPLLFQPTLLSTEESIILIQSITEDIFCEHSAFKNLIRTLNFSSFLYKLFDKFFLYEINALKLSEIIEKLDVDKEDKNRLILLAQSFRKYEQILLEKNYLTTGNICIFTTQLFKEYPQLLEITKQNCENIVIDEALDIYPTQMEFLKTITSSIDILSLQEKRGNKAAQIISEKYLGGEVECGEVSTEIKRCEFNDVLDEAKFIASDIIEKIDKLNYSYSDFVIALNNPSSIKLFNNMLLQANIPTNINIVDEVFQSFFIKLNQYFNICVNLEKLEKNTFFSKAKQEKIYEEINLYFGNIVSETLENTIIKDKYLKILENSETCSLIECVKNNLKILTKEEAQKIQFELEKIESLFNLYKNSKFSLFTALAAKGIGNLTSCAKENIARLIKKINNVEKILIKIKRDKLNYQELVSLFNYKDFDNSLSKNCVKIVPISKTLTSTKVLYLPDLTEKSIPLNQNKIYFISNDANEKFSLEIKKIYPSFENIIESSADQIFKSAKNLKNILTQDFQEIIISTHKYEEKKGAVASIFYQSFSEVFPLYKYEDFSKPVVNSPSLIQEEKKVVFEENNVLSDNELLKLNASAISNFQTCPRKFYFSNLIGLKSKSTFAASYGTIVHCVFELFNKNYLDSYNKETLMNLAQILFDSNKNLQKAVDVGFSQRNIDLILATDILSLEEMFVQFCDAVSTLENYGFFNKVPDEIICEKGFEFVHPQMPDVFFDGRIDAIYKFKDEYVIVDFKTGANKPELTYLISENGVNFKTATGRDTNVETKQKEYEYQIPLYYFATQYSEDFKEIKDKVKLIGLQYIRPKNKNNGYKEDLINCDLIKEFEEKIIQNLQETVVKKIRNKAYFEPAINEIICKNCSFKALCEEKTEEENE